MEIKSLGLEVKELSEPGEFKGYVSTRGKDAHGDVIEEGAFKRTLEHHGSRFPALWFHDPRSPIGMGDLTEDGHGLYVEGALDLDVEAGRDVYSGMQKGYIDRFSIGFRVVNDEFDRDNDTRILKEIALLEFSPVTRNFAANDEALLAGVKSFADLAGLLVPERLAGRSSEEEKRATGATDLPIAARGRGWDADAAMKRVRNWAEADEEPNARYRRAFLWYDPENSENFSAYKIPFADVIDGTLTAIPRGIFAGAAAVQGARGGVSIPDSDVGAVKSRISTYYGRMRSKFGDDNLVPPWEKSAEQHNTELLQEILAELKQMREGGDSPLDTHHPASLDGHSPEGTDYEEGPLSDTEERELREFADQLKTTVRREA